MGIDVYSFCLSQIQHNKNSPFCYHQSGQCIEVIRTLKIGLNSISSLKNNNQIITFLILIINFLKLNFIKMSWSFSWRLDANSNQFSESLLYYYIDRTNDREISSFYGTVVYRKYENNIYCYLIALINIFYNYWIFMYIN